jgi:hypothetical protein
MMKFSWTSATALVACVTLNGCGGGDSDGVISVTPDKLSFQADLYDGRPEPQSIRLEANKSEVELPTIFYDTDYISGISTSYTGNSIINARVNVVTPQSLGVGRFTTNLEIVSSQYQENVKVTYTVTDSIANDFPENKVDTISPYVAISGKTGEFVLRGKGFSSFSNNDPALITVGTYEVDNYSYINDTELKFTLPPMEAGSHDVVVNHTSSEYSSNSSLEIVDPITFSNFIITTDRVNNLIYDDKKKAILTINLTTSSIERYSYTESGAWHKESLFVSDIMKIEIGSDGNTLIALTRRGIVKIDLSSPELSLISTIDFPEYLYKISRIASCNSGLMILGPSSRGELAVFNIFTDKIYVERNLEKNYLSSPILISQNSGSQVAIKESGGPYHILNCNGYKLKKITYDYPTYPVSMFASPDNSLFLIGGIEIHDSSFKYLHSLPDTYHVAAFSSDNSMLYAFNGSTKTITSYDLTDINNPIAIGELTVEIKNTIAYGIELSEDDNTLFLSSYDKIHIIDLHSSSLLR